MREDVERRAEEAQKQAEDAKKWAERQVKDAKKQIKDVEKVNQMLAQRIRELEAGNNGQPSCSDIPTTT